MNKLRYWLWQARLPRQAFALKCRLWASSVYSVVLNMWYPKDHVPGAKCRESLLANILFRLHTALYKPSCSDLWMGEYHFDVIERWQRQGRDY